MIHVLYRGTNLMRRILDLAARQILFTIRRLNPVSLSSHIQSASDRWPCLSSPPDPDLHFRSPSSSRRHPGARPLVSCSMSSSIAICSIACHEPIMQSRTSESTSMLGAYKQTPLSYRESSYSAADPPIMYMRVAAQRIYRANRF